MKVFDFGLAKIAEPACPPGGNPSHSPTLTPEAFTRFGDIVGTVGYMAPEQATGGPVDKRADIFAFGVVMYEMLTGNRLFKGETASETLASVLKDEPNLERIPPKVRPLLQRCLEKEPRKRLRDIGDLDLLLQQPTGLATRCWNSGGSVPGYHGLWPQCWLHLWRWLSFCGVARQHLKSGRRGFWSMRPAATNSLMKIPLWRSRPTAVIWSSARAPRGTRRLWLRPLDSLGAQLLQGSEGANHPFWSPNSKSVAFFAGSKLKRSDIDGGAPQVLCDGQFGPGGAWGRDGVMLFGGTEGLMRVAASGGVPQRLTQRDTARKESQHSAPQFLPDGKKFLYFIASTDPNVEHTQFRWTSRMSACESWPPSGRHTTRHRETAERGSCYGCGSNAPGAAIRREAASPGRESDAAGRGGGSCPDDPCGFLDLRRRTTGVPDGR